MAGKGLFLIIVDLCSIVLFSGIIYGWAPLNEMLIQEKFYISKCEPGQDTCDAQKSALNLAFTLATTAVSTVALPAGMLVDSKGPLVGCMLGGSLNIIGLLGIVLSRVAQVDLLFLVSFVILACGGSITMFCGYALPFLFPQRCTLLIECTSCLFDASCIMFTFFKFAYDGGVSFQSLFVGYAVLCVVNFGALAYAWRLNNSELWASKQVVGSAEESVESEPGLQSKPLGQQVRTFSFAIIFVWAALQVARSNLYLGSVDLVDQQYAAQLGKTSQMPMMTSVVGLIIPQGWISVPLIEFCIHKVGVFGTLQVTNLLSVLYCFIQLIPNLELQIFGAIVFAFYRAFLFSILTAYNAETFGPKTLGRVMGLCFLIAAVVNLVQNPLVDMTLVTFKGDFRYLTMLMIAVVIPLPIMVGIGHMQKRRQAQVADGSALVPRSASLANSVPSRTFSHSTAVGTAQHLVMAAAIERSRSRNAQGLEAPPVVGERRG